MPPICFVRLVMIDQVLGDGVSSWRDIEGYARLAADRLESSQSMVED
jgi:hypothetical protein